MSKGTGTVTSTGSTDPWDKQQSYLTDIFGEAERLYHDVTPPQYYSGDTYATASDTQNNILSSIMSLGQNDTTFGSAISELNNMIGGGRLYGPGYDDWSSLFSTVGGDTSAKDALYGLAYGGSNAAMDAGYQYLLGQAGGGLGSAYDTALNGLYGFTDPYLGSTESNYLLGIAGGNPVNDAYGLNALLGLAGGSGLNGAYDTAAERLAASNQNPYNNSYFGAQVLQDITGMPVDQTHGSSILESVANKPTTDNPGLSSWDRYASGSALDAASNPYTSDLAQSVLSQVVPAVQSQFIEGGMLNSPQAAYATSQGAAAALGPILAKQYQQEEANQIQAGSLMSDAYLQNLGLISNAGQGIANIALGAEGLKANAGNNLLQGALSGNQQIINQALGLGNLGLGRGQLAQSAADNLLSGWLTGTGLQENAASQALQGRLGGSQQVLNELLGLGGLGISGQNVIQNAAQGLAGLGVSQGNLAQSAASTLGSQELQGRGLQEMAAQGVQTSYGQGIQQMLAAMALAPQLQGMQYTALDNAYTAAAMDQQLRQQVINDAVQRWNYNETLPWQMLNQYLGQITGNYGGSTSLTQPFFQNTGANALGGALGGASLGGTLASTLGLSSGTASLGGAGLGALLMLLSDRRAKTDIVRIGELDNGLPVYRFRYLGDPVSHIGLMADEVETARPEAVAEGPFGFKMVDYALATA